MKKFGDLTKGDNVYIVILGPGSGNWRIRTLKVLSAKSGINYIILSLADSAWSGYYPKDQISARCNILWSDREEAIKFSLEKAKKERNQIAGTIDDLISEYDDIEKFIEKYEGC